METIFFLFFIFFILQRGYHTRFESHVWLNPSEQPDKAQSWLFCCWHHTIWVSSESSVFVGV